MQVKYKAFGSSIYRCEDKYIVTYKFTQYFTHIIELTN